jgi:hypothetical protein
MIDLTTDPDRHRQERQAGLPEGHLADQQGIADMVRAS